MSVLFLCQLISSRPECIDGISGSQFIWLNPIFSLFFVCCRQKKHIKVQPANWLLSNCILFYFWFLRVKYRLHAQPLHNMFRFIPKCGELIKSKEENMREREKTQATIFGCVSKLKYVVNWTALLCFIRGEKRC